jgi:hypothetical protein
MEFVVQFPAGLVDTGPDEEVRSEPLCHAKEFIDVALPVADVDASFPAWETLSLFSRR